METQAEAQSWSPGVVLEGRYELLDVSYGAGPAATWSVRDMAVQTRKLAIRRVCATPDGEVPDSVQRHVREMRSLRHPGIIPTLTSGASAGCAYLILEHVEAVTLTRHVTTMTETLTQSEVLDLVLQVAAALTAGHHRSPPVVHGGLHPDLVLISPARDGTPRVRLADFGVAVLNDSHAPTGPGFDAPERQRAAAPTVAMDVYSLGRVLRWLLDGATWQTPRAVRALIVQATDPTPTCRPTSVERFIDELTKAWTAPDLAVPTRLPSSSEACAAYGEAPVVSAPPEPPVEAASEELATRDEGRRPWHREEGPWDTAVLHRSVAVDVSEWDSAAVATETEARSSREDATLDMRVTGFVDAVTVRVHAPSQAIGVPSPIAPHADTTRTEVMPVAHRTPPASTQELPSQVWWAVAVVLGVMSAVAVEVILSLLR